MLRHIVLLKFKPDTKETQKNELESELKALPGKIPEIKGYEMGFDVIQSPRSYDFGLLATFENIDALKVYQQHPQHVKVLNKVLEICDGIIAVDFEV